MTASKECQATLMRSQPRTRQRVKRQEMPRCRALRLQKKCSEEQVNLENIVFSGIRLNVSEMICDITRIIREISMANPVVFPGNGVPWTSPHSCFLTIWREVCRHIAIEESVARAMPLLRPASSPRASCWSGTSIVATTLSGNGRRGRWLAPARLRERRRQNALPEDLERILGWCREGQLLRASDRVIAEAVARAFARRTSPAISCWPPLNGS